MDDPWGSPWADESAQPPPNVDAATRKEPAVPHGQLPLNGGSTSPWDDDDGFGEWAALPASDEVALGSPDGLEDASIGGWTTSKENEAITENETISDESRLGWFSREPQPANGENLSISRPHGNSRRPSPDPWGRDELRLIKESEEIPQAQDATNDGTMSDGESRLENRSSGTTTLKTEDSSNGEYDAGFEKPPSTVETRDTSIETDTRPRDKDTPATKINTVSYTSPQVEDTLQRESLASRPSTSPSDHSVHDDAPVESPRTSFDDEDRRPKAVSTYTLRASAVALGSDKKPVDAAHVGFSINTEEVSSLVDGPAAESSEDEFGDFEEEIPNDVVRESKEPEDPSLEEASTEKPKDTGDVSFVEKPQVSTVMNEPSGDTPREPTKMDGPIKFDIDISLVGKLFVEKVPLPEPSKDCTNDLAEIETIIKDSLSSTEQRKTWYRISRYGTIRKHNAGDEDNYLRVSWRESEVRAKTYKIVARWIEESRFGGGVVLGGGGSSGSLFGWGQKDTAPVSLAAVLAGRSGTRGITPDPATVQGATRSPDSIRPSGSQSKHNSINRATVSQIPSPSPSSVISPSFSWSSVSPISTISETAGGSIITSISPTAPPRVPSIVPAGPKLQRKLPGLAIPIGRPAKATPPAQAPIVPAGNREFVGGSSVKSLATSLPVAPGDDIDTEADDDWGEMISTPSVDAISQLSPSLQSHTRSGSFMDAISPASVTFPALTGESHLSRISLNTASHNRQSKSSGPTSPDFRMQLYKAEVLPSTTVISNPWTSADFDLFDAARPSPEPLPAPTATLSPIPLPAYTVSKVVTSPSQISANIERLSKEEMEQSRIIKSIVQNLPDLSYMLRR